MRLNRSAVLSAIMTWVLVGCTDKSTPTSAPEGPKPSTAPAPTREPGPKTPADTPSGSKEKPKVEIAKGRLSINGTAVPLFGELAGFERALGKPSGVSDGSPYRSVYWKSLGIKGLQETSGKQLVVSIAFHFQGYDDILRNETGGPFPGVVVLEGQPITKNTDLGPLVKKISGLKKDVALKYTLDYPDSTHLDIHPALKGVDYVLVERLP
jgi:hypothetical protein